MCDRCEELEEELAFARSELAAEIEETALDDIRRVFGITSSQALVVLALYRAKGRLVSVLRLEEAAPRVCDGEGDRTSNVIPVMVSKIRAAAGADFILNTWGRGYRLPPSSRDIVGRIIGDVQPTVPAPELQDLHGRPSEELRALAAHIAGICAHRDGDGGVQAAQVFRRIADRLTGQPRVAA